MLPADLTLFSHVASRPEEELDLAQAALLIAEPEYPSLDVARYLEAIDRLGVAARRFLDSPHHAEEPPLRRITRFLHGQQGFHGNAQDYYDPKNSFLNEVLDRKTGIPITLAVVVVEVAHRAGVEAWGVGFPGHFLVRGRVADRPIFIDPFNGNLLDSASLRELHQRATGQNREPDPRLLEPVSKRAILTRMLMNLRTIYQQRSDGERLRGVLLRLQILSPSDELDRALGKLPKRLPN
jgi:regulator of sirC expression with transglutaminase-like and TPR domain